MTILEDNCVTTKIIAFERYNFTCGKQKQTESLEQFHSELVELASRADCGDREEELAREMFTAHMNNDKKAEELLAQTRSSQDAYEYAIHREKGIEHSRTMNTNPFGGNQIAPKQEPVNYINTPGRFNYSNTSNIQRGRRYKCGNQYNQKHLQSCPAKVKFCSKCAKRGHFAKVCRSTRVNYLEDTQIDQQEELETEWHGD